MEHQPLSDIIDVIVEAVLVVGTLDIPHDGNGRKMLSQNFMGESSFAIGGSCNLWADDLCLCRRGYMRKLRWVTCVWLPLIFPPRSSVLPKLAAAAFSIWIGEHGRTVCRDFG